MPQKLDKVKIASVRRLAVREAVKVCAAVNLLCRCQCTSFRDFINSRGKAAGTPY